jgi:hypothetical protein
MQIRKPLGLYNMKTGRYLTILKRWLMVTKVINNQKKKSFLNYKIDHKIPEQSRGSWCL